MRVSVIPHRRYGCSRTPHPSSLIAPPSVFVFISHLTVPAGDCDAVEHHFRNRAGLVDAFPGFLYLQLLRPQGGDATHTFLTAWESREAFRAYMNSEAHAVSHSREPGEIMARTTVRHEAFEVLMDSRRQPGIPA
jgi:heme-degrading monooxygenase HmoA